MVIKGTRGIAKVVFHLTPTSNDLNAGTNRRATTGLAANFDKLEANCFSGEHFTIINYISSDYRGPKISKNWFILNKLTVNVHINAKRSSSDVTNQTKLQN